MTRPAHQVLDKSIIRAIARLMHLHHQTNAHRLAERFGVTPKYVRKIYAEHGVSEQVGLREALRAYIAEPEGCLTDSVQNTELKSS